MAEKLNAKSTPWGKPMGGGVKLYFPLSAHTAEGMDSVPAAAAGGYPQ